ncbi:MULTISPECIES: choice-of-anchor V domain-containing protein [unclassified Aureispira]|uniref:choice-of-anchor V domain-containing protein n=1 Tax=unclassified Aureispira TaxID=2649989 RepID=UPI0006968AF8|nr:MULTISPECIES: choice-of-anchor V domain-containing protein [unclassified Aureispira]WMX12585.1 choice-of-anchor V domain-containing protein [Aureispira sp. CCB-E]
MKTQLLGVLFFGVACLFILQSASGGRAAIGGQDRTGAPGALGTNCTACHANNGAFSNPQINITVSDASGTAVTSYVPGDTYTISFNVTSGGTPSGYGMQAVILDAANANAGDFLTTTTSNTQLSSISNGREFVEHQGRSGTGVFTATWEAPATGTGAVTVYGIGMAVNGSGTAGDNTSPTEQVVLSESTVSPVNDLNREEASFDIFPIPNDGSFVFTNKGESGPITIQVYNMEGRSVYSENVILNHGVSHSIYCKNLVSGIYVVEMQGVKTRQTQQMIVQ